MLLRTYRSRSRNFNFSLALVSQTFCLLVLIGTCRLSQQGFLGNSDPLYSQDDQVYVLNSTTIKQLIYNSPRAWLVEFFSSWCGHCIHFAPKWKQFAKDLASWQNCLVIAGIDCADDNNIPVCRENEIMGYPSLRFFGSHASQARNSSGKMVLNTGLTIEKSENLGDMKRSVMDALIEYIPSYFTLSSPEKVINYSTLWNYIRQQSSFKRATTNATIIIIVFESESSYLAKELAIEFSKFKTVYVLTITSKTALYSHMGLQSWPAVGYVKRDLTSGVINIKKNANLVQSLESEIAAIVGVSYEEVTAKSDIHKVIVSNISAHAKDELNPVQNIIEQPLTNPNVVSIEDLIHAVRNSLRNEVGLLKQISGAKLQALKNYVTALAEFFPADRRELVIFLMKLGNWLLPFEQIDDTTWLDKLTELEMELHPFDIDVNNWGNCRGSVPGRRGYPCSLWVLFHTLTVIAYDKGQHTFPVLDAIHGFVKEFFGCRDCSEHFTQMVAEDGALMIKPVKEQIMWLWRAHNKVNLRLEGSLSEDPEYPKSVYPNENHCPQCYHPESEEIFDEEKVLEYLIKVYSKPERVLTATKWNAPKLTNNGTYRNRRASGFFSGMDYWLFCFVYLSVAVLLVLGYLHFRSRGRLDWSSLFYKKIIMSGKSNV